MNIEELNAALGKLSESRNRDSVFAFAYALIKWMGLQGNEGNKPRLLAPQTQKLKDYLVPVPMTVQPQLYRLTADGQNIRIRFATLKKIKKEYISQLVDNDPGLTSYQASIKGIVNIPGRPAYIPSEPYFIHFITTSDYHKLILVFNQGEQKRIITFRHRLTQTQYHKVVQQWKDIASKPKPELSDLLWRSLDIKEVNKEFYKKIKDRFDDLVGLIEFSDKSAEESHIRQFVIRLIGRYVFIWFLKEKEIIPFDLINSSTIKGYKPGYYQNILLHLFFHTLNTEVQQRNSLILDHPLRPLFANIPYLNGGLFEDFPDDKPFHQFVTDEWLISFVKVLESFDFTVDESSVQYQQVAIDPEMLGRIFENLLASQNPETEKIANQRKAFGAFYTPREIVEYMVDASLKAFLEQSLFPDEKPSTNVAKEPVVTYSGTLFHELEARQIEMSLDPEVRYSDSQARNKIVEKIEKLFLPNCDANPFDKRETIIVQNALRDIKVLDPACGSGAFPMGMLLRLMNLREIVGNSLNSRYELKSEILSRNIYGVDIMSMAVEIARLRAWLSLVLEVDYNSVDWKHNFNIKALPNLDFKFICANSLIDNGYDQFLKIDKGNLTSELIRLNSEIDKLQRLREQYFDPRGDKQKKEELQQLFLQTKEFIKSKFSSLKATWNLETFLNKIDDWNPFDDSHSSSFFSPAWMFGINDGFDVVIANPPYVGQKGHKEMFQHIKASTLGKLYHQRRMDLFYFFIHLGLINLKSSGILTFITTNYYLTATYSNKLRQHIYEDATILSLINFNELKIFESAQGQHNLITILKKGKFNEINAKTCITSKQGLADEIIIARIINGQDDETEYYSQSQASLFELGTLYIRIEARSNLNNKSTLSTILNRMRDGSDTLNKYLNIEQGIVSGADKVSDKIISDYPKLKLNKGDGIFILTKEEIKRLNLSKEEKELIKPVYKNSDLKKWYFTPKNKLYLIYLKDEGKSIELGENLANHFEKYKNILVDKKVNCFKNSWLRKIVEPWLQRGNYFVLFYPRNKESFEKLKIVNSRRSKSNSFALEDKGYYEQSDIVFSTLKSEFENTIDIKYFLGILNSKLLYNWFYHKGKRKGEQLELFQKPLSEVPIRIADITIQRKIVELVDSIIEVKRGNSTGKITILEKGIDILIYKLYDLTYHEVKIIDPEFLLTEKAFNLD